MRRIFRFAVLLAFFAISSSFIIPVKAQQLVFYCEPEDEDGIEELKQMVSEFKKLSKEEIKLWIL